MINFEGIGDKPIHVYKTLINLKFLFSILCTIIIIVIWITYDNNIYTGLSMSAEYKDDDYKDADTIIFSCLIIFSIILFIDLAIQVIGITYNFYRLNAIILSLKIFETFLLALFFLDSWNYVNLYYIMAITQFPCFLIELFAILVAVFSTFKKYNIIRNKEVKSRY